MAPRSFFAGSLQALALAYGLSRLIAYSPIVPGTARRSGTSRVGRRPRIDGSTIGAARHHAILKLRYAAQLAYQQQSAQDQQQDEDQPNERRAARIRSLWALRLLLVHRHVGQDSSHESQPATRAGAPRMARKTGDSSAAQ